MNIFRLAGIKLTLDESEEFLAAKVADALAISPENIVGVEVIRKAIDATWSLGPNWLSTRSLERVAGNRDTVANWATR